MSSEEPVITRNRDIEHSGSSDGAVQRLARLLPAALLGIVAFTMVLVVTDPPGPGLDPDALSYLGAAESLAGHGEYRIPAAPWASADSSQPLTHFPPGYPTLLALPTKLGMAPTQSARLVEAIAAFVTVTTLVLVVSAATSTVAGMLLGVALMATPALYEVHASVLSEPLFLACEVLTLAAMVFAPTRPLRAGLVAAIAATTRYAGVAFVGAAACWQLLQRGPGRERMRNATLSLLPGVVLLGAWVVRTRSSHDAGAIRKFALYGALGPTLREGAATLRDWIVPDPLAQDPQSAADRIPHRGLIALAACVVVMSLVIVGARRAWQSRPRGESAGSPKHSELAARVIAASALLAVCYIGVVVASRVAADPNIPFDTRMLSPLLLLLETGAATGIALWWRGASSVVPRAAVGVALTVWMIGSASVTRGEARAALTWGSDFAGEEWRRSELLRWARLEGGAYPLYSNWPGPVYFYLHRPAHYLPAIADTAHLAAFSDTLRKRDGRVLAFAVAGMEFVTPERLARLPGLRVVARLNDGLILAPIDTRLPPRVEPKTAVNAISIGRAAPANLDHGIP